MKESQGAFHKDRHPVLNTLPPSGGKAEDPEEEMSISPGSAEGQGQWGESTDKRSLLTEYCPERSVRTLAHKSPRHGAHRTAVLHCAELETGSGDNRSRPRVSLSPPPPDPSARHLPPARNLTAPRLPSPPGESRCRSADAWGRSRSRRSAAQRRSVLWAPVAAGCGPPAPPARTGSSYGQPRGEGHGWESPPGRPLWPTWTLRPGRGRTRRGLTGRSRSGLRT